MWKLTAPRELDTQSRIRHTRPDQTDTRGKNDPGSPTSCHTQTARNSQVFQDLTPFNHCLSPCYFRPALTSMPETKLPIGPARSKSIADADQNIGNHFVSCPALRQAHESEAFIQTWHKQALRTRLPFRMFQDGQSVNYPKFNKQQLWWQDAGYLFRLPGVWWSPFDEIPIFTRRHRRLFAKSRSIHTNTQGQLGPQPVFHASFETTVRLDPIVQRLLMSKG